jgi:hypothetical protein
MRIAVMLSVLFLGACESGPPTRGLRVAFNAVCNKENEGKRVMVEGYVNFPHSFKEDEVSIMLRMRPEIDLGETPLGVSAKLGTKSTVSNYRQPTSATLTSSCTWPADRWPVLPTSSKCRGPCTIPARSPASSSSAG